MTSQPDPTEADFEIAHMAEANGCTPFWHDGTFGWSFHCSCDEGTHYCDQQCSAIDKRSARRRPEGWEWRLLKRRAE